MAPTKKQIAVVLYPGMTALDVVGMMEVLITLNIRSPYRVVTVAERIEPIPTDTSLTMVPNKTFAELSAPFGLILPGGGATALTAGSDDALWQYVLTAGASAELLAASGTGSLILAQAGLLADRRATTHHAFAQELNEFGARYVRRRWVDDDGVITAAGVTAGIDMALYLVAETDLGFQGANRPAGHRIRPPATLRRHRLGPGRSGGGGPEAVAERSRGDGAVNLIFATTRRGAGADDASHAEPPNDRVRPLPGLTPLDLVGPLQVFTSLHKFAPAFRPVVVAERLDPMASDIDVPMLAGADLRRRAAPRCHLRAGGVVGTLRAMSNEAVRGYVRTAAESARYVASVCTGSLILASVGLLTVARPPRTGWRGAC